MFSPFPCANLSSRLVPLPWIISKNASMTKGHLTQISQKTFQSPKPSQLKLHISSFHQGALGILPPSALQSHWRHFTESLFGRLAGQDLNTSLKPLTNWILHGNTHRWIGMDWFGGKKMGGDPWVVHHLDIGVSWCVLDMFHWSAWRYLLSFASFVSGKAHRMTTTKGFENNKVQDVGKCWQPAMRLLRWNLESWHLDKIHISILILFLPQHSRSFDTYFKKNIVLLNIPMQVLFGQGSFDGMIGVNRPQNTQSCPRPVWPKGDLVSSGDFDHPKGLKRTSGLWFSVYPYNGMQKDPQSWSTCQFDGVSLASPDSQFKISIRCNSYNHEMNPAYNPNSKVSRFIPLTLSWYWQANQPKKKSLNTTQTPPRNTMSKTPKTSPNTVNTLPPRHQRPPKHY